MASYANLLPNYPDLESIVASASDKFKNIRADIVFIWDGSGALDESTSAIIYEYILAFLKPFTYGPDSVQAAMVVYEAKVTQTVHFNEAKTLDEFKKLVDSRGPPQGNEDKAGIDDALRMTLDEILNESNGSRKHVHRMVVFFPTQKYSGPNPASKAALLRQKAELFIISMDSKWKLADDQLLELAGDKQHIYQYNDANVQDTLPVLLPLATWRAIFDAVAQMFFVSFIDDSAEYNEKFNLEGSSERHDAVQGYHDKISNVYQHSALHASIIDVIRFEQAEHSKTRVFVKTIFTGYMHAMDPNVIQTAAEYLAKKQSWLEFKVSREYSK